MIRIDLLFSNYFGRISFMAKNEKTSKSVASKAAKALKDPKATKREKSLAGSVLTQAPDRKKKQK